MARASSNFPARLRRMLLMIPWLLDSGGSTVPELAVRFGITEDEVIRDLNLVMCCGVPPYGAEHMITVMLDDDGSVMAWKGPFFSRPMRLTPTEGFAVLTAGTALLAVPGADPGGPLATALAKLEAGLGSAGSVAVELESPPLLGLVRTAVETRQRLAVSHYSAWRDEVSDRIIEPSQVFSADGRWYVVAADSRSGTTRRFRIDRMSAATPTGEHFDLADGATPEGPPDQIFSAGDDTVEATLVVPASARWIVEAYDPLAVETLDDGRLRLRLAVAGERWLERLLFRVGPGALVESPPELTGVGATAARRLLALYGE